MEVTTQYAGVSHAGYYGTKTTNTTTFEETIFNQGRDDEMCASAKAYKETVTPQELYYQQCSSSVDQISAANQEVQQTRESTGETMSALEVFRMLAETLKEEHKLTPDNIAVEKDWRKMDDEEWNKLLESIDKYIDAFKERLKKLKERTEEAAMKAGADAPADRRVTAISNAILSVINSGYFFSQESNLEKLSWTYEMETDDQTILAVAKAANEAAHNALTKTQEIELLGDTTVGISSGENVKECASLKETQEDKVWTITCFSQDGIICKQGKKGEKLKELWRIDYKNTGDAKRVWDFLDKFDPDTDLKFSGLKSFWESFLSSGYPENAAPFIPASNEPSDVIA